MTSKIALLMCGAAVFAAAEDSALIEKQQGLLNTLDSIDGSVMGLRLNGTAKGGVISSTESSDQLFDGSDNRENQAYTDVNLKVSARPSAETEAKVELRLHKDWQSAYEEAVNPIIGHWFSYDGKILDKHVDFNLGYMRVGYTPLTIYVPQTEILQEPEIFASKRVDALAMRNLDTTSNRLLQGLNVAFNSFEVGPLSNIYAQVTGSRIRNSAKKYDEVFFDYDWSDRILIAANAGVDLMGIKLGGNYVYTFDRVESARSNTAEMGDVFYEDNLIFSGVLGFDSKKMIMDGKIRAGVDAEFASSKWTYTKDTYGKFDTTHTYNIKGQWYPQFDENGFVRDGVPTAGSAGAAAVDPIVYDTLFYIYDTITVSMDWKSEELDERKGIAFNVSPFVAGEVGSVKFDLKGTYVHNDEKFWSEQASSNYYIGNTTILNGDAIISGSNEQVVEQFRSGSLENMYFSVYNTNVLQQQNMMSKNENGFILAEDQKDSYYTPGRLYNNYRLGHFYKNGYKAVAYKYMELMNEAAFIDPSVNMAMPMGLATPDRNGFAVNGNVGWNDAITLNLRFSQYNQDVISNTFTTYGAGLGVDVAPFLGWNRRLIVQGSFEAGSESDYLKRETSRIVAGLTADVWGPFTLLGGFQSLEKKFTNGLPLADDGSVIVNDINETLILGGLQIKLGPGAVLDLQGGTMANTVDFATAAAGAQSLELNKLLLMGNITVLF